jgi:hypothetical protein
MSQPAQDPHMIQLRGSAPLISGRNRPCIARSGRGRGCGGGASRLSSSGSPGVMVRMLAKWCGGGGRRLMRSRAWEPSSPWRVPQLGRSGWRGRSVGRFGPIISAVMRSATSTLSLTGDFQRRPKLQRAAVERLSLGRAELASVAWFQERHSYEGRPVGGGSCFSRPIQGERHG